MWPGMGLAGSLPRFSLAGCLAWEDKVEVGPAKRKARLILRPQIATGRTNSAYMHSIDELATRRADLWER